MHHAAIPDTTKLNISLSFPPILPTSYTPPPPIAASVRDPLPSLLPPRPPPSLLHCPTPISPPPTPPPPPPPPPLHTVPFQHRLASPPSTTIHAALAATTPPVQAFCTSPRPPPTTLPASRHPGCQSAHLTPSCNPRLATSSCCVVHDHATLTSAALLPAYTVAHLAQ